MIIGLCGAARSGKNTVAENLSSAWNASHGEFDRDLCEFIQIAEILKRFCRELFDWTEEHTDGNLKDVPDLRYFRTCKQCNGEGYVAPKVGTVKVRCNVCKERRIVALTPRHAMQQLGGEFAQNTYANCYANRAVHAAKTWAGYHPNNLAIITDVRYITDALAIKDAGGIIIQVERPLQPKVAGSHSSEQGHEEPNFKALVTTTLVNDGTLEDLNRKVRALVQGLRG